MGISTYTEAGVSLRQLFPEATLCGGRDVRAMTCCDDSRACSPGDVFVAMLGRSQDGHDFYRQAIARGAVAVVAERPLPTGDIPLCIVDDSRLAYGRLCHALAGNPSEQLKVIGVTGTLGKTVTACLLAGILETSGRHVGLLSTLGYCDGRDIEPATVSTPLPQVAAHWLARMTAAGCTHAVVEATVDGLRRSHLAGMALDVACITNVRQGSAADTKSWQQRCKIHARLFDHLSPQGFAILNADDEGSAACLRDLHCPVLTIGLERPAEVTGTLLERCVSEQTFLLHAGNETIPVRTQIIGDHHIYNCLTAAAVGLAYGFDLATIARGLEVIRRLPGRLDRIECGQSFGVFVDAARTSDGLAVALNTLRDVTQRRLICVLDMSVERRHTLARVAASRADLVLVTGTDGRGSAELNRTLKTADSTCDIRIMSERSRAIQWALTEAHAGDCVLLAGASAPPHHPGDDTSCDDQELARQWLYANAQSDSFACRQ